MANAGCLRVVACARPKLQDAVVLVLCTWRLSAALVFLIMLGGSPRFVSANCCGHYSSVRCNNSSEDKVLIQQ